MRGSTPPRASANTCRPAPAGRACAHTQRPPAARRRAACSRVTPPPAPRHHHPGPGPPSAAAPAARLSRSTANRSINAHHGV
jgi:hypothetical protein